MLNTLILFQMLLRMEVISTTEKQMKFLITGSTRFSVQQKIAIIDIKWNYEQHFGRVKDPIHFEDENWHCWDEKLDDINCPE